MKTSQKRRSLRTPAARRSPGFAWSDLLLILGAATILSTIVIASLKRTRAQSHRTVCQQNIQQLTTSFQLWLHDYEDRMPWMISTAEGGSSGVPAVYSHWKSMSNHIGSARILMCPGLARYRLPVQRMDQVLQDLNVAYAIGLDGPMIQATKSASPKPAPAGEFMLVSDMDLMPDEDPNKVTVQTCGRAGGIRVLTFRTTYGNPAGSAVTWSSTNHHPFGQIGTLSGTVLSLDTVGLRRQFSLNNDTGGQGFHFLPPDLDKNFPK